MAKGLRPAEHTRPGPQSKETANAQNDRDTLRPNPHQPTAHGDRKRALRLLRPNMLNGAGRQAGRAKPNGPPTQNDNRTTRQRTPPQKRHQTMHNRLPPSASPHARRTSPQHPKHAARAATNNWRSDTATQKTHAAADCNQGTTRLAPRAQYTQPRRRLNAQSKEYLRFTRNARATTQTTCKMKRLFCKPGRLS